MTLINLKRNQSNDAKSVTMKYRMWLADFDDVDVDNFPQAEKATIKDNPLKEGKKFVYLDAKFGSVVPNAAPGESPFSGKLTISPIIEGITPESLDWIYKNQGKQVIAIWERCSDGQKFIGGTPCSGGLTIKYQSIGTQDGGINGIALTLEGGECPDPFYFYSGNLLVETDTTI